MGCLQCSGSESHLSFSGEEGSGSGTGTGSLLVPGFGSVDGGSGSGSFLALFLGGSSISKSLPNVLCLLALPDLLTGFPLPLPFGFGGIRPSNLVNNYPNLVSSCSKQNGYPNVYFGGKNLPPLEEFHLDLHGSGKFFD